LNSFYIKQYNNLFDVTKSIWKGSQLGLQNSQQDSILKADNDERTGSALDIGHESNGIIEDDYQAYTVHRNHL